jgi:NAD(P)-dependent dehydrogenase (short-subunit alcohol dehydrogenase family)
MEGTNVIDLQGHTIVVTGGSTLIGHGVVRALHASGAAVVIADIDADGAKPLASELGARMRFERCDITSDTAIAEAIGNTVARFGSLDGLVNLACSYVDAGFASTRAQWHAAFDVNVFAAAVVTQHARPHLAAASGGAVVNVASISSKVAQTARWVYPASKAALVQLTRSMATDLAVDGIRVNSVSPGWTWSSAISQLVGGDRAKADAVAAPFHLTRRTGDPAEIGAVVAFLLSPAASGVTGADWAVDGGYSAMGPEQSVPAIAGLTK